MKAGLKTILLSVLGAFSAFSAVTFNSCNEDKCKAVVCAYGGVCKDGTCYCQSGYEGPQCETIVRERYKGTWTVFEKGSFTRANQYTINIEYGATLTDLVITNFYNKLPAVKATINRDTLFIAQQTVEGYTVQGKGYLIKTGTYGQNGTLTVRYTVRDAEGRVNDFGTTNDKDSQPSVWSR